MQGKKTPEERREMVLAMLRSGKTYREIKIAMDIPLSVIHSIAKDMEDVDLERIVKEIKRGFVARHLMLADFLSEAISLCNCSTANIKDVAIAMAIVTDKAMKMEYYMKHPEGRTTSNTCNAPFSPQNQTVTAIETPNLEHIKEMIRK